MKTTIANEPSLMKGSNNSNMVYDSTIKPGYWTEYSIEIENTDSHVKVLNFFMIDVPDGWAAVLEKSTLIIPPGKSTTIELRVRPPLYQAVQQQSGPGIVPIDRTRRSIEIDVNLASIILYAQSQLDELAASVAIAEPNDINIEPAINIDPINRVLGIMEEFALFACRSMDPDGRIINFRWDITSGEGYLHSAYGGIVEHSFSIPGTYDVTLRVIDDDGAVVTEHITIQVGNGFIDPWIRDRDDSTLGCGCGIVVGEDGPIEVPIRP